MAISELKHYRFKCEDCGDKHEKAYWKKDGEWEVTPSCLKCNSENLYEDNGIKSTDFPMINIRPNIEKNLPTQSKEFFKEFKKRHSKYGNTVRDY